MLWLLIETSGQNSFHSQLSGRKFFHGLYDEARAIKTRQNGAMKGSLADMMLWPDKPDSLDKPDVLHKQHKTDNGTKLTSTAARRGARALFLSLLPNKPSVAWNGRMTLKLYEKFGVPAMVEEKVLLKALAASPQAEAWRRRGRPVLALGLGPAWPLPLSLTKGPTVAAPVGKQVALGEVRHLALIPLDEELVPVPTVVHEKRLQEARRANQVFHVSARDDPALIAFPPVS